MSSSTWSKTIKFNWIEKMWTQLNSTSFSSADLLCHNFGMPRWRTSDQLLYGGDATMFWTVCLFLGPPKLVLFRWHVYPPSCFRSSGVCELSMFYFVAMFAHLHVSFKRCVWALHVHRIIDGSNSKTYAECIRWHPPFNGGGWYVFFSQQKSTVYKSWEHWSHVGIMSLQICL